MVYKYSWNGIQRKVSAEEVARHLALIEERDGEVTREAFLESARPEESELHCLFEWDDSKAAEKYRLIQAQTIICSVHVEVVADEREPVTVRAFVQDKETSHGYVRVQSAFSEQDKAERIIAEARRDAEWFKHKYESFVQLAEVIKALDAFLSVA